MTFSNCFNWDELIKISMLINFSRQMCTVKVKMIFEFWSNDQEKTLLRDAKDQHPVVMVTINQFHTI